MIHSIGLTGGIGSGKSTIAGILKQLGYPVYLADPEASRLINRSVEIRNDLTGLFGGDLHSFPTRRSSDLWREQQNSPLVFFESAILFEAGLTRHFDFIICVTASEVTRLKRVILRDATNEDKVKERMQNQAADTEKCKNSDFIIYNDEDHMVVQQVLDVLNKLNLKIQ